jgi:hydroxyethylthiazole kinase-like uncharacterized protein yjeF
MLSVTAPQGSLWTARNHQIELSMKILTTEEMRATDARTVADFDVSSTELMENAGAAVARFCLRRYPAARRVVVLCGLGNNGGDGMVAARHLASPDAASPIAAADAVTDDAASTGREVIVLLLGRRDRLSGDAAAALHRLANEAPGVGLIDVFVEEAMEQYAEIIESADLLLDAVVGTGFKPPLRGTALRTRDAVNACRAPVVAVDLPSGWDADATTQHGALDEAGPDQRELLQPFRADAVVTFTAPKMAHVLSHLTSGSVFGPVVVAPIGSPPNAIVSEQNLTWTGASKTIVEKPRDINSNKGRFGHILLIGGSYGKAGAPSMSSLAALRAGAGLVTAAVPRSILNTVALVTPELMMMPLEDDPQGVSNLETAALSRLTKGITVLACGPGLSTDNSAPEFVRTLLAKTDMPIVLDADALNAFAGKTHLLKGASDLSTTHGTRRTIVLTPHPGEMARLAGMTVKEVEADRIGLARRFATENGITLVLKGWRTLVAHPDGRIAVNTTGNPAMAKGGSGDILTGIVAAMLGQFPEQPAQAVEAAVYLHGLAADFAAHALDEHTVLATDTLAHLSDAFRYRTTDADGFTWITGLHDVPFPGLAASHTKRQES